MLDMLGNSHAFKIRQKLEPFQANLCLVSQSALMLDMSKAHVWVIVARLKRFSKSWSLPSQVFHLQKAPLHAEQKVGQKHSMCAKHTKKKAYLKKVSRLCCPERRGFLAFTTRNFF